MEIEAWREAIRRLPQEEFRALRNLVQEEARAREVLHLSALRAGDWVEFDDPERRTQRGIIVRINSRTASVLCEPVGSTGRPLRWRVAASYLRRILPAHAAAPSLPPADPEEGAPRADADSERPS
ncbi:MAG: hypothetical protein ACYDFT_05250 [Thermoplasmata archaeon]